MKIINPVYKKELKQSARMWRTVLLIFFYNSALALFGLFFYFIQFNSQKPYRTRVDYSGVLVIYTIITGMEFVLALFLIPSMTAGAVASEKERQTLDILLTTQVSPIRIISGKLLASISTMLLLVVSSLPIISIVFSVGGISMWDLLEFILFMVVTAIYVGSISMFFSCICKKTTTAAVSSYAVILLVVFGTATVFFASAVMYNSTVFGMWEYDTMLWYNQSMGRTVYMLFLNPLASYVAMLRNQVGFGKDILDGVAASGGMSLAVLNHWFSIGMVLQMLVSFVLLLVSAYKLTPVKKKRARAE